MNPLRESHYVSQFSGLLVGLSLSSYFIRELLVCWLFFSLLFVCVALLLLSGVLAVQAGEYLTVWARTLAGMTPVVALAHTDVPLKNISDARKLVHELKERYMRSVDHSPSALVFATGQGAALAADNLRKKSLRTACRAGLQRIDWHALQHSHGRLLHAQGTPLKAAQAQRDTVNLLGNQLFPNVPKLENGGNTALAKPLLLQ